jgi:hypothetical protein
MERDESMSCFFRLGRGEIFYLGHVRTWETVIKNDIVCPKGIRTVIDLNFKERERERMERSHKWNIRVKALRLVLKHRPEVEIRLEWVATAWCELLRVHGPSALTYGQAMMGERPAEEVNVLMEQFLMMHDESRRSAERMEVIHSLALRVANLQGRTWRCIIRAFQPNWQPSAAKSADHRRGYAEGKELRLGDPILAVQHLGTVVEVLQLVKTTAPLGQTRTIPLLIAQAIKGELDDRLDAQSRRELKESVEDMEARYPQCTWALTRWDTFHEQVTYNSVEAMTFGSSCLDKCIMRLACVVRHALARAAVRSWAEVNEEGREPLTHREVVSLMDDQGLVFPQRQQA